MIFERRAYVFRPGGAQGFLDAQPRWNTQQVFGPVLDANLCYFHTLAGEAETIVHLYRFASVADWRERYARFYAAQSPEYFATVRPLMLRQDAALFEPAPFAADTPLTTPPPSPRPGLATLDPAAAVVVERCIDFLPGGLPACAQALAEGGNPLAGAHLVGAMVSIIGRLHRVLWYHAHADLADADAHRAALAADPATTALDRATAPWVAGRHTTLLRPVALDSRRRLFHPT